MDKCTWRDLNGGKDWNTGCGKTFYQNDGGIPAHMGMVYCPFCGKPIVLGGGILDVTLYIDSSIKLEVDDKTPLRTNDGWNPEFIERLNNIVRERGIEALIDDIAYDYYMFEEKA